MKRIAIFWTLQASLALLLFFTLKPAHAATAFFTGNQRMVQTVTYQQAWNCQYNYNGRLFWMTFNSYCPSSVQIQ